MIARIGTRRRTAATASLCLLTTLAGSALAQEGAPPDRIEEVITVTATRLPVESSELATASTVVDGRELALRPGLGLDEALRWEPGFSLFRRTPARSAHPTTHGVNLRGIAPTGTSRALVLVDGAPLADAFGGWVQWDRVPRTAIDRVEVVYGGGSAPYGNQALAGTVQVVTRSPERDRLGITAAAGEQATWDASALFSSAGAGLLAAASAFGTDGYHDVAAASRGTIDRPVAARGRSLLLKLRPDARWSLVADGFRADRDNGTPAQVNRVEGYGAAVSWQDAAERPRWSGSGWLRRSRLTSVFSAVFRDRSGELPVLAQEVPAVDVGGAAVAWLRHDPGATLTAGVDVRRVAGRSEETVLTIGLERRPGGRQVIGGAWIAGRAAASDSLGIEGSLRLDGWHNRPDEQGDGRGATSLSPRVGLVWQADAAWTARLAGYGAFRAPTLNELYRQFRVGDVITRANAKLEPERSWGMEGGVIWRSSSVRAPLRIELGAFWGRLGNAVVNATVGSGGGLTFRQRQNLGAARTAGLELDARWRRGALALGLAAHLVATRVMEAASPELVGNRLPQVPRWRLTASAEWTAPAGWSARLALHGTGSQFEDDLESLVLAAGATLDAALRVPLARALDLSLRAQNLLDERLEVARTPVLSLGPPRQVLVGLSWWPGGDGTGSGTGPSGGSR